LKDDVEAFSFPLRRRSVGKLMVIRRSLSFLFLLLLVAGLGNGATAQSIKNMEGAVAVFGQFTGTTSGDGVTDSPTESLGTLATFRQSFHPWLGYEVNYSYTRFTERYSTIPFGVQDNVNEVTGAYLVQGPSFLGLQPFGAIGFGALIFLPTTVGGQKYNQQTRIPLLYEVGVNYPLITSHFGLRLQYRGLSYKTPDFNATLLTTGTRRTTSEPSVGAYLRF
jgi:opacity protein-like surface antigen